MLVILDPGHGTKASGTWDPGATFENFVEADLTMIYAAHAAVRLASLGHRVEILGSGPYRERHARANYLARMVPGAHVAYVQCHCNAGGGTYGLVCHQDGSTLAYELAGYLAVRLGALPGITRPVVAAASERGGFPRARGCVAGIDADHIAGCVYEPGFVDTEAHGHLFGTVGLESIGIALAEGLHDWGGR